MESKDIHKLLDDILSLTELVGKIQKDVEILKKIAKDAEHEAFLKKQRGCMSEW